MIRNKQFLKTKEQGYALIIVLLVITVFSVLGLTVISVSFNNTKQFSKETTQTQALNVAEMGLKAYDKKINDSLNEINQHIPETFEDFESQLDNLVPPTIDEIYSNMQENPEYRVTVEKKILTGNKLQWTVTSVGTSTNDRKTITQVKTFQYGLTSNDSDENNTNVMTPEYKGLSLPYIEGSVVLGNGWYCSGNVKIKGQTNYCTGETRKSVELSTIKTAFQKMPLTSFIAPIQNANYGNPNISSGKTFNNDTNFSSSLIVSGSNVHFKGRVYINGDLNASGGNIVFDNDVYITNAANISGNVTFKGKVYMGSASSLSGTVVFNENTHIDGDANISGTTQFIGNVYVGGNVSFSGNVSSEGYFFVSGRMNLNSYQKVHYTRTVYVGWDNVQPMNSLTSSSTIDFMAGAVFKNTLSTNSSGLITFDSQERGETTPVLLPITVSTSDTKYQ